MTFSVGGQAVPIRTFTIYEVPNSYVNSGTSPTITATFTMSVSDDDGLLQATDALDTGTAQTITVDGQAIDSYQFFYDDTITIGGGSETIKTFQLTIDGTVRSFVMNDTGSSIPGASVGTSFSLDTYANYTALDYADLPCFVRGTLIRTASGDRPVEELQVGDMVETGDHGLQPIRWIGSSPLSVRDLLARSKLKPIRIPANAFGAGMPTRDLFVSPQHRILLSGWQVELNFGTDEVFSSAKSLVGKMGIRVDSTCREVEYFHFMFDQKEVVFSEGLPTESFLVGDTIRDAMDTEHLQEKLELFPELAAGTASPKTISARQVLKSYEVEALKLVTA